MLFSALTNEELIRIVDNKADVTDLERELAMRLAMALDTIDEETEDIDTEAIGMLLGAGHG